MTRETKRSYLVAAFIGFVCMLLGATAGLLIDSQEAAIVFIVVELIGLAIPFLFFVGHKTDKSIRIEYLTSSDKRAIVGTLVYREQKILFTGGIINSAPWVSFLGQFPTMTESVEEFVSRYVYVQYGMVNGDKAIVDAGYKQLRDILDRDKFMFVYKGFKVEVLNFLTA
jgi:uncharacterized SAM-binding protein YcdF (DUF218 family)